MRTNTQRRNTHPPTHTHILAHVYTQVCVSLRLSAAQHCPNQSERGRCGVTCCLLDVSPPIMHCLIGINWVHTLTVCLHVVKNKCWLMLRSLYPWWIRTPVPSWVARSVSYYHYHHHPHLRMFLFPVVCHSPQVQGSPQQTGSYNPPLGPLQFEEGGLYLRTEKIKV